MSGGMLNEWSSRKIVDVRYDFETHGASASEKISAVRRIVRAIVPAIDRPRSSPARLQREKTITTGTRSRSRRNQGWPKLMDEPPAAWRAKAGFGGFRNRRRRCGRR